MEKEQSRSKRRPENTSDGLGRDSPLRFDVNETWTKRQSETFKTLDGCEDRQKISDLQGSCLVASFSLS